MLRIMLPFALATVVALLPHLIFASPDGVFAYHVYKGRENKPRYIMIPTFHEYIDRDKYPWIDRLPWKNFVYAAFEGDTNKPLVYDDEYRRLGLEPYIWNIFFDDDYTYRRIEKILVRSRSMSPAELEEATLVEVADSLMPGATDDPTQRDSIDRFLQQSANRRGLNEVFLDDRDALITKGYHAIIATLKKMARMDTNNMVRRLRHIQLSIAQRDGKPNGAELALLREVESFWELGPDASISSHNPEISRKMEARNRQWMKTLTGPHQVKRGKTALLAVGYFHFLGDTSMQALFEEAGYRVELELLKNESLCKSAEG